MLSTSRHRFVKVSKSKAKEVAGEEVGNLVLMYNTKARRNGEDMRKILDRKTTSYSEFAAALPNYLTESYQHQ